MKTTAGFDAFCGDINVANRMGGYNGWHPFLLPLCDGTIAGLYDKPTIEGQPTQMGSFIKKYATAKTDGDPAARMIQRACGPDSAQSTKSTTPMP